MPDQVLPDFPERVERAVGDADKLAAALRSASSSKTDVTAMPEYQELVRLKAILEMEVSRILTETARIASELGRPDLAESLGSVKEAR